MPVTLVVIALSHATRPAHRSRSVYSTWNLLHSGKWTILLFFQSAKGSSFNVTLSNFSSITKQSLHLKKMSELVERSKRQSTLDSYLSGQRQDHQCFSVYPRCVNRQINSLFIVPWWSNDCFKAFCSRIWIFSSIRGYSEFLYLSEKCWMGTPSLHRGHCCPQQVSVSISYTTVGHRPNSSTTYFSTVQKDDQFHNRAFSSRFWSAVFVFILHADIIHASRFCRCLSSLIDSMKAQPMKAFSWNAAWSKKRLTARQKFHARSTSTETLACGSCSN